MNYKYNTIATTADGTSSDDIENGWMDGNMCMLHYIMIYYIYTNIFVRTHK